MNRIVGNRYATNLENRIASVTRSSAKSTGTESVFEEIGHYMLIDDLQDKYGTTMTPTDAAAELHQHPTHVRKLCRQGYLPAVRIGSRWRIPTAKFAAILDRAHE